MENSHLEFSFTAEEQLPHPHSGSPHDVQQGQEANTNTTPFATTGANADPPPPYYPGHDRCIILPLRRAEWRLKGSDPAALSTLAATVLVSAQVLDGGDVELLHTSHNDAGKDKAGDASGDTDADSEPTDPISSLAISTYRTLSDVLRGAAAGPQEAVRQIAQAKEEHAAEQDAWVYEYFDTDAASTTTTTTDTDDDGCPTPSSGSRDSADTLRPSLLDADAGAAATPVPTRTRKRADTGDACAAVAVSAGKGVARIVGAGLKAPGLYTYGLARGFDNVPRLYGDETVRERERVEGVASGLAAAGKGLGYGVYDGITGFFTQPVMGAQKEGAVGFLKGFGKGLGGIVCKPAAGACGVPGYAFTGIQKSIEKMVSRKARPEECVAAAKVLQGEEEMRKLSDKERMEIVSAWLARKIT